MKSQIGEFNMFNEELKTLSINLQTQIEDFISKKRGFYEDIDDVSLSLATYAMGASLCSSYVTMYYRAEKGIPFEQPLTKSQIDEVLAIVRRLNAKTEELLREHLSQ